MQWYAYIEKKFFRPVTFWGMLLGIFLLLGTVVWHAFFGVGAYTDVNSVSVKIGDTIVQAETAKEEKAWTRGLSGRSSLSQNGGMLFVFPALAMHAFWMKGMHFPLDIIWIADNKVVGVAANALAPAGSNASVAVFSSPQPINAVLEVNSGFAAKHGIYKGVVVSVL